MPGGSLAQRWSDLVRAYAGPAGPAELLGRELLARYAEPHRSYHDRRHLTEVLEAIDALAPAAPHPAEVRLAAWFHDAVYDPRAAAGANERASAELARARLGGPVDPASPASSGLGLPPAVVSRVAALVEATADHDSGADPDAAVLCDADLAILAAAPERYAAYAAAVRVEYAHVPDPEFRAGRAAILETFVARPRIYVTDAAARAWERPARANLAAELARLTAG